MTEPENAASRTRCDCGHLRGHHNTYQGNVYYLAHTRCLFEGCGCPKFIAKPQDSAPPDPEWVTEMARRIDQAAADLQAEREAR